MHYGELLIEANKEESSTNERKKRLQELHAFIKSQHHLHDDHGSSFIGSSNQVAIFKQEN